MSKKTLVSLDLGTSCLSLTLSGFGPRNPSIVETPPPEESRLPLPPETYGIESPWGLRVRGGGGELDEDEVRVEDVVEELDDEEPEVVDQFREFEDFSGLSFSSQCPSFPWDSSPRG